jgi:LAGLIDADG DNA endonuclease family
MCVFITSRRFYSSSNNSSFTGPLITNAEVVCSQQIIDALVGDMLSDAHMRKSGRRSQNNRVEWTLGFKNMDYINHLRYKVYKDFFTSTPPNPNPKSNPTQYWFATRAPSFFTIIAESWYHVVEG